METEGEAGAQNVVAQKARFLQKLDGVAEPGHGVGVLGADVDVAAVGRDGVGGQHHAFNEPEGVAFHDRAVHEGAGVALVAVADHIAGGLLLAHDLLPLAAGGISAAAAAAKARGVHLVGHGLRRHLKEGFLEGREAAGGDVLVQGLGVQLAAVFQGNTGLLGDEGDLVGAGVVDPVLAVGHALDGLVAENAALKQLLAVVQAHLDALDDLVALLDPDQGAQLADALTAGALDAHRVLAFGMMAEFHGDVGAVPGDFQEFFIDLLGAGGDTAGAGADQNPTFAILDGLPGRGAERLQGLSRFDSHTPSPLSLSISSSTASGVIRGYTSSLTMTVGARPQAPRHDTVSTVKSMSSVVCFFLLRPRAL